jgi:cell division protein FtsB
MVEEKNNKQSFPRFWIFVILILGSLILGDLNQRMADARHLEKDLDVLVAELNRLDNDIFELDKGIEEVNTDDFIDDWAHEEAKMVKDGETLVILIPTGLTEEPDGPNLPSDSNQANKLEVWVELIFGQ